MKNLISKTIVAAGLFAMAQTIPASAQGGPSKNGGLYPTYFPISISGKITTELPEKVTTKNGTRDGYASTTTTTEVKTTDQSVSTDSIIQAVLDGLSTTGNDKPPTSKDYILSYVDGKIMLLPKKSGLDPICVPEDILWIRIASPVTYSLFSETLPYSSPTPSPTASPDPSASPSPDPSASPSPSPDIPPAPVSSPTVNPSPTPKPFNYTSSYTAGGTKRNKWQGWCGVEGAVFGTPFDGVLNYGATQQPVPKSDQIPQNATSDGPVIVYPPIFIQERLLGPISGFDDGYDFLSGPPCDFTPSFFTGNVTIGWSKVNTFWIRN